MDARPASGQDRPLSYPLPYADLPRIRGRCGRAGGIFYAENRLSRAAETGVNFMKRRTVLLGGLQAGLALAMPSLAPWRAASAQSPTNVKFVVDFTYQGNHAIWGLALAQGLFAKEGLNVTMDRGYGSGDTIVKVASGAYDVGFADVNAAVKFNAQNPDKRVIAVLQVFDRTLSSIITLKKSGITDPKQLPGHTIGAPEADASRLLFPAFAKKNGIDPSAIIWKSIAPNLRETILIQGQVDAITGFTSSSLFNLIGAGVPRDDVVLMPFAKFGMDLYGNAVIVREDTIKSKPDMVRGFVKATIEGTKALIKDPQAGLAAMHARDPMFDVALEADRLQLVLNDSILTPDVKKNGFGYIVPARMDLTINSNLEANGLNVVLTPDQLYTTSFLPPQAERMPPA
jgi:NitT/TauT family transport system substrate-binding protein